MAGCVFCKIVAGQVPAEKVYEDQDVLAFLDIHPVNPGHLLVIPKAHIEHFQDLDKASYADLMQVVRKLARQVKAKVGSPRVGLIVEGFDVAHMHVHVVPIYGLGDIRTKRTAADMQADPDFPALKSMASKLKQQ